MLSKRLNSSLTLIKTALYPRRYAASNKRYRATLGVGGNIGDVFRRLDKLSHFFKADQYCDLVRTGPILKNPPFGYLEQDDFYNSVMIVQTNLQPKAFLKYVLEIERKFGRKRSFENAPRTLDIDVIFFENRKMQTKELPLPHPHWKERESVVIPMTYMERR